MKSSNTSEIASVPMAAAVFYILFALADGDKHGYAIMQETLALSDGTFRMGPATLYTNIHRLLEMEWIKELPADGEPRRRYYRLARQGKTALEGELQRMRKILRRAQNLSLA